MKNIFAIILTGLALLVIHSCSDDDFPVPPASTVSRFSTIITNDAFAPATVTFKNESIIPERAGRVFYQWNFGDGSSSTEENPTHDYASPGGYTVTLVLVTDKSLEIAESSRVLSIKDPNATGVPLYFWTDAIQNMLLNDQSPFAAPLETPGVTKVYGMAVDTVAGKLYIGSYNGKKIFTADLDGSNLSEFRTSAGSVNGITIDYKTNRLYWGTDEDGVKWADMTSSDVNQMEILVTDPDDPTGLAIDPNARKLFWNNYAGGLWSIDLDDGSAVPKKVADNPEGGGSVIVVNDRIFYDEYNGDNVKIKSAKIDGSDAKEIVTGMSNLIYSGIVYNKFQDKLYWADRGAKTIKRANLDGSAVELFYSASGEPVALALGKMR